MPDRIRFRVQFNRERFSDAARTHRVSTVEGKMYPYTYVLIYVIARHSFDTAGVGGNGNADASTLLSRWSATSLSASLRSALSRDSSIDGTVQKRGGTLG